MRLYKKRQMLFATSALILSKKDYQELSINEIPMLSQKKLYVDILGFFLFDLFKKVSICLVILYIYI